MRPALARLGLGLVCLWGAAAPHAAGAARTEVVADAQPLPRYLDQEDVRDAVRAWVPALSTCASGQTAPSAATVTLVIDPAGRVATGEVVADSGDVSGWAPCVRQAWSELRLAPHDEDAVRVRFALVVVDGQVVPPPAVRLELTRPGMLFLYVSPMITAEERGALVDALGVQDDTVFWWPTGS